LMIWKPIKKKYSLMRVKAPNPYLIIQGTWSSGENGRIHLLRNILVKQKPCNFRSQSCFWRITPIQELNCRAYPELVVVTSFPVVETSLKFYNLSYKRETTNR
jgi:hypothetical protein